MPNEAELIDVGESPASPLPPADTGIASDLPHSLIDLKEQLTVLLLITRQDLHDLARQTKFTQQQVARMADCAPSTLQEQIKAGKLKTGSSGWITRPQLIEWLGCDPIQERIDKVLSLEKAIIKVTAEIEAELTNQNR